MCNAFKCSAVYFTAGTCAYTEKVVSRLSALRFLFPYPPNVVKNRTLQSRCKGNINKLSKRVTSPTTTTEEASSYYLSPAMCSARSSSSSCFTIELARHRLIIYPQRCVLLDHRHRRLGHTPSDKQKSHFNYFMGQAGCVMTAVLFNLIVDWIMTMTTEDDNRWTNEKNHTEMCHSLEDVD